MEPSWQHEGEEKIPCSDESKYRGVRTLLPVIRGRTGDMKRDNLIMTNLILCVTCILQISAQHESQNKYINQENPFLRLTHAQLQMN